MLMSMTGHGRASSTNEVLSIWAEIRAVNNRSLKVSVSCSDRGFVFESKIKSQVQNKIRRGSIHVQLDIQREDASSNYRINDQVLRSYHQQLSAIDPNIQIDRLIDLPGVVEELNVGRADESGIAGEWLKISAVIDQALVNLNEMRSAEGASMTKDLLLNCEQIRGLLAAIEKQAPRVVADYSKRLTDRINQMLAEFEVSITPTDIAREVGMFADKSDISEEIVRLQTHLNQFLEIVDSSQSDGRKLEFVTQEMLRETNTIGSKANDAEIAQNVVEIKTAIERIREMIQNIE